MVIWDFFMNGGYGKFMWVRFVVNIVMVMVVVDICFVFVIKDI